MSDYIKQLEEQNEELKNLLANAQLNLALTEDEFDKYKKSRKPGIVVISHHATDKLMRVADVVLERELNDRYKVVKNRHGEQGRVLSFEQAERLVYTGDTSCLE